MILTGFRHGVSDITKSVFQIHGVDRDSEVAIRKRVSRAKLLEFFAGLPPCLIGIEACPTAHHWSWKLQALGRTVRLMPPSYVKAYLNRSKNDANDAAAICEAVTRWASNSAIDCPSTPAAPWLAFTRLKASQTSRLGILNGFALSTGSSRFQLAQWPRLNNATPSLRPRYRTLDATTGCSVPAFRVGTLALAVGAACGLSLHAISVTKRRFSRSIRSLVELRAAYMPDVARAVSGILQADPGERVTPRF
jgi:hypothetical protein